MAEDINNQRPAQSLTTDQKLDKVLAIVAGHTETLTELTTKVSAIEETVSRHTGVLDGLAKDVKVLLDEKTAAAHRLDRLEEWAEPVGEKVGIRIDL